MKSMTVAGPCGSPGRKGDLSPGQRRLVEVMQHIRYGRIQGLVVCQGEPVFDPPPCVIRKVKMGGENAPRPEALLEDFAMRGKVRELLEHLACLGTGTCRCIEVQDGLPFTAEIEEPQRGA